MLIDFCTSIVDNNAPQHSADPNQIPAEEVKEEEKVAPRPTLANTLGAVLDRLHPKKSFKKKTQNEIIEEINRRRNLGQEADENPYFDIDGQMYNRNGIPVRISSTTLSTTSSKNHYPNEQGWIQREIQGRMWGIHQPFSTTLWMNKIFP